MKGVLSALFWGVILAMGFVTLSASLDRGIFEAGADLWPDPWFRATLADAYFAFLTIYLWVAYRERSWPARIAWLLAFLLLGNFAIAAYVLLQLRRLRPEDGFEVLLTGRSFDGAAGGRGLS